jgi:hypothetical protein
MHLPGGNGFNFAIKLSMSFSSSTRKQTLKVSRVQMRLVQSGPSDDLTLAYWNATDKSKENDNSSGFHVQHSRAVRICD